MHKSSIGKDKKITKVVLLKTFVCGLLTMSKNFFFQLWKYTALEVTFVARLSHRSDGSPKMLEVATMLKLRTIPKSDYSQHWTSHKIQTSLWRKAGTSFLSMKKVQIWWEQSRYISQATFLHQPIIHRSPWSLFPLIFAQSGGMVPTTLGDFMYPFLVLRRFS